MATVGGEGDAFTLALLFPQKGEKGWATTKVALQNEYISYEDTGEYLSIVDVEELITTLSRLLAGAYEREYSVALDRAGLAFDLYPPKGSRKERREKDCVAAVRILMRSKDKKSFLNGVHTTLLHRKEIEAFVSALRQEFEKNYRHLVHGSGKYHFVGVSPRGMEGCNYLYLDESGQVESGDYVWVRMGRRQIEQVAYVDSVRAYTEEDAPYNPQTVKRILRIATRKEIKEYLKEWKK